MNTIVKTADGSDTIYVPELDEHYHSVHGAVQESTHIFIKNGFDSCNVSPVNIFEVGFGTGLNAFLTAIRAKDGQRTVNYTTIEKYPLTADFAAKLNYNKFAADEDNEILSLIHSSKWNQFVKIHKNFNIKKIPGDFKTEPISGFYDLIYFDAFGPDKQPDMWSSVIFTLIGSITKTSGIFVTYSAKGEVKRNLRSNGFEVSLLPGPPGKRQIIRAIKI